MRAYREIFEVETKSENILRVNKRVFNKRVFFVAG